MFISLYTTRLILNALGASDFGIFNIVGGAIAMLGFLNAAMAGATQRFMSYTEGEGDKEKQKKIFNISFVLHMAIALIMGVVLLIAGYFFFNGILNIAPDRMYAAKVVYASLIVSTVFTVMTVPYDAVLNAHENMLYYSIVGVVESLLKLGAAIAIVHAMGDKLVLYGILMAGIPLVTMTIMRIYCQKHYIECIIAPRKFWDKGLMIEITGFAGWNLLGTIGELFSNYGRAIIANIFFGTIVNASTAIVGQLNGQLLALSNNMMKSVNPVIVKAEGSGNRESMFKTTFTACKLSFIVYAIFAIPFNIESSFILSFWLKNVPAYTEVFFKIFIFQVLIEQISLPLGTVLSAVGRIKEYNMVNIIVMFLSVLTIYILFELGFPPHYMMIVTLSFSIVMMIIKVLFCLKLADLPIWTYIVNVIIKCFSVLLIVFLFTFTIKTNMNESFVRFCVVGISSSIFLLFLSYIIILSRKEKIILKSLIVNRLKNK